MTFVKHIAFLSFLLSLLACGHSAKDISKSSSGNLSSAKEKEIQEHVALIYKFRQEPLFRVCAPLRRAYKSVKNVTDKADLTAARRRAELTMSIFATMPMSQYDMHLPETLAFGVWTIQASTTEKGDGYEKLSEFPAQKAKLMAGLQAGLPMAHRIDTRTYYSVMLSRLMLANPKFAESSSVVEFCDHLEVSLGFDEVVDLKKSFEDLMKMAKVSAAKINYDPNWKSEVSIRDLGTNANYFSKFYSEMIKHRETLRQVN